MRIIGGKNKGKKINISNDNKTRPLRDLVKESIFNLVEHSNKFKTSILNSNVLDLFSGTGSFGLECYSRGAKFVTFVENYSKALKILKKNLIVLNATKSSKIIEENCFEYLSLDRNYNDKFDIIFLDPPYKDKNFNKILININNFKVLGKNGIIILHRHKNDNYIFPPNFKIFEEKNYGISKIIYFTCID